MRRRQKSKNNHLLLADCWIGAKIPSCPSQPPASMTPSAQLPYLTRVFFAFLSTLKIFDVVPIAVSPRFALALGCFVRWFSLWEAPDRRTPGGSCSIERWMLPCGQIDKREERVQCRCHELTSPNRCELLKRRIRWSLVDEKGHVSCIHMHMSIFFCHQTARKKGDAE